MPTREAVLCGSQIASWGNGVVAVAIGTGQVPWVSPSRAWSLASRAARLVWMRMGWCPVWLRAKRLYPRIFAASWVMDSLPVSYSRKNPQPAPVVSWGV